MERNLPQGDRKEDSIMGRGFIIVILSASAAIGSASVSTSSSPPQIVGSVQCIHGKPLVSAIVSADGKGYTTSGYDGEFTITWLTAGTHLIECSYPGITSSKKVVSISSGATRIEFKVDSISGTPAGRENSCPCGLAVLNGPTPTWEASYCGCGGSGKVNLDSIVKKSPAPAPRFALEQNHPNPTKGTTAIRFELAELGPARLRIYDVTGRIVRSLLDERLEAGPHSIVWDGRNEEGHRVSAGVYLYRLEAANLSAARQLVFLP